MKERHSIISSADKMLKEINNIISTRLKTTPRYNSAIVSSVNIDGTVNVYFPPDKKIFTNISNQTPFTLAPGDSVEIILKEGSYNNCWICAKHQTSLNIEENLDPILPIPTEEDEGKILVVKNGRYQLIEIPDLKRAFTETSNEIFGK